MHEKDFNRLVEFVQDITVSLVIGKAAIELGKKYLKLRNEMLEVGV